MAALKPKRAGLRPKRADFMDESADSQLISTCNMAVMEKKIQYFTKFTTIHRELVIPGSHMVSGTRCLGVIK